MSDDDLRCRVVAELGGDPQVDGQIFGVSVVDGTVTLRGTVASLRLKRAACRALARVRGVAAIANEVRVQLPVADRRDDQDLRGDVLEALMLDLSVPTTVEARVRNGFVTLTGTVQWNYQRAAAESRAANVPGVAGLDNAITLTQAPDADAAHETITAAFQRNAVLDATMLWVQTSSGGLVIVSGTVNSWSAHDQALAAAWAAPGVTQVDDLIRIVSRP